VKKSVRSQADSDRALLRRSRRGGKMKKKENARPERESRRGGKRGGETTRMGEPGREVEVIC